MLQIPVCLVVAVLMVLFIMQQVQNFLQNAALFTAAESVKLKSQKVINFHLDL